MSDDERSFFDRFRERRGSSNNGGGLAAMGSGAPLTLGDQGGPQPANSPGANSPSAFADRITKQMLGVSIAELQGFGDQVGKLMAEFRNSLARIEQQQTELALMMAQLVQQRERDDQQRAGKG
jgi:hypothetical protein